MYLISNEYHSKNQAIKFKVSNIVNYGKISDKVKNYANRYN